MLKRSIVISFLAIFLLPSIPLAKSLDHTFSCDDTGHMHVTGTWDPRSGEVHLQFQMDNCGDDEKSFDGVGTIDGTVAYTRKAKTLAVQLEMSTELTTTKGKTTSSGTSNSIWDGALSLPTKTFIGEASGTSFKNVLMPWSPDKFLATVLQNTLR